MNTIDNALAALEDAILNSPEYREYDKQRNLIKQYPEVKAKLDDFRRQNFLFQTGADNALEQMDQIEKQYADFREQPMVSEFLAAELAFCRMMQDINLRLTDHIDFDLP